jgi:ankyrin repeat protein
MAQIAANTLMGPNRRVDKRGSTPLIQACENGEVQTVRALLKTPGIDLNKRDDTGCTALHTALYKGHPNIVPLMITDGRANINTVSDSGMSPLHSLAAWHITTDTLKWALVRGDADPTVLQDGKTPRQVAIQCGNTDAAALLGEYETNREAVIKRLQAELEFSHDVRPKIACC